MTKKEKRLLSIALLFFFAYILPFELIPKTYNFLKEERQSIYDLRGKIQYYKNLGAKEEYWREQYNQLTQKKEQILQSRLQGSTPSLMNAYMQGRLEEFAARSGVSIKSIENTDVYNTELWILISQTVQFEADSKTMMSFLQLLDNAKEEFFITSLEVHSYGKKVNGTIKITAYNSAPVVPAETSPKPTTPSEKNSMM